MDWTEGYVAELSYLPGFYRELTPAMLAFGALARGARPPALGGRLTYCELGCGLGVSANLIAAANPEIEVYAMDFNPGQIAGAQTLADEAGTSNVHFHEASFADYLARDDLPPFDFVTLHGIYSWVSAANRELIVEFLRRNLKAGGLVYVSYNVLPGWAAAAPLRRLFVEHARTTGGVLTTRIEKALAFVDRLKAADVRYFTVNPGLGGFVDGIKAKPRNYIAHEYFNATWEPMYFADVARDLSAAKLLYVGSVHFLDHVDGINLTAAQRQALGETGDPLLQETIRDYATLQQFRRDLFAKGTVALEPARLRVEWGALRLALTSAWPGFDLKVTGALGEAEMALETYRPVLDLLAKGPRSVSEILADPSCATLNWTQVEEVVKVLIGGGWVQPCLDEAGLPARRERTDRYNAAVLRRAPWSADLHQLASPVTGGGVSVNRFEQLFLLAGLDQAADPVAEAWRHISAQGQALMKDGKPLDGEAANREELAALYAGFQSGLLPVLRTLGVVDAGAK